MTQQKQTIRDILKQYSTDVQRGMAEIGLGVAEAAIQELIRQTDLKARIDELDHKLPKLMDYDISPELASKVSKYIDGLEAQLAQKDSKEA